MKRIWNKIDVNLRERRDQFFFKGEFCAPEMKLVFFVEGKIVTFFRCFCLYERYVHGKQTSIAIWRDAWRFKPFKRECNAIHSSRWMIFLACQLKWKMDIKKKRKKKLRYIELCKTSCWHFSILPFLPRWNFNERKIYIIRFLFKEIKITNLIERFLTDISSSAWQIWVN